MSEYPREVETIAEDFVQRRSGLLKALTEGQCSSCLAFVFEVLQNEHFEVSPQRLLAQTSTTSSLHATLARRTCAFMVSAAAKRVWGCWRQIVDDQHPTSNIREGSRDGSWTVDLPAEDVPPELPEPCLGINFARDGMARRDWLALVAVHSDAWLMAVAFFYAVKLDSAGR